MLAVDNKLLGSAILDTITDLINKEDINNLKQIGVNQTIIDIINKTNINKKDTIVLALNRSINFSIDTQNFIQLINSTRAIDNKNHMLHDLIKVGATYDLIKNFFSYHSNRRHTTLRKNAGINSVILYKDNPLDQNDLYQYFYKIEDRENRRINIQDLYNYHFENKVSINKVYKNLIKYLEEKN